MRPLPASNRVVGGPNLRATSDTGWPMYPSTCPAQYGAQAVKLSEQRDKEPPHSLDPRQRAYHTLAAVRSRRAGRCSEDPIEMMGSTATSAEHRMPLRLGRWALLRGRRSERSSLSISVALSWAMACASFRLRAVSSRSRLNRSRRRRCRSSLPYRQWVVLT